MSRRAEGRRIAILAADGFEESELFEPKSALENAGAEVHVISLNTGEIEANRHRDTGKTIPVNDVLGNAKAERFDALVIPGGLFSPDALRINDDTKSFVRDFFAQKKPVAAICHGPQILIDADVVKGRTLTSVAAIRTDLVNAGAKVVDEAVVVDEGLVTSRTPKDLEAFCAKLVEEVCEGKHTAQAQSV